MSRIKSSLWAVLVIAASFCGQVIKAQERIEWLPLPINHTQNPDNILGPNSSGSNPSGTWLVTNLACYGDVLITQTYPTNVKDFVAIEGEDVPNAGATFVNGVTGSFTWGSFGNFNFGDPSDGQQNYTLNFYFLSGPPVYPSVVLCVDGLADQTIATVSQPVVFRGEFDLVSSAHTSITNQPYNVVTGTGSTNAGTIGTIIGSYFNKDHFGDNFNTGYGLFQPVGPLQTTSLPTGSGGFPVSPPTVPYLSLNVSQIQGDGIGFALGYFCYTNTCSNSCIAIFNPDDIITTTCSNCAVVNYDAAKVSDACCSSVMLSYTLASGSCFPLGTNTVQVTATDACGNSNECSFRVIVLQNTNAPTFISYPDPIIKCFPANCGPMPDVTSQVQAVSAGSGNNVTITQSIPPGTQICASTTLTFTATDLCGNSTNVTVPFILTNCCLSIDCSNIVVTSCSNSLPVSFLMPYVDQCCSNCPASSVYTPASGSIFPLGTTTVTNIVTDASGASNYCEFTVTVIQDAVPPVFGCLSPAFNLVPNGGFETYTSCPSGPSEISLAIPWFQPTGGTPDFFNSCAPSSSGVSTPLNMFGTLAPHGGNGYAGGTAYTVDGDAQNSSREYLEVPLTSQLVAGQTYQVAFYVSLTESFYGIDSMGAYFSVGPIDDFSTWSILPVTPQVRNTPGVFLTSIGSWTLISGTFTALGGEDHLTIGNFSDDIHTFAAPSGLPQIGSIVGSYYYVDDVSVSNMCGCPSNKVVFSNVPWTFDIPSAYDPVTGQSVNVTVLSTVTNGPCPTTITQTWIASNSCASSTCSQMVTVLEVPQILCTNMIIPSCVSTQVVYNPSAVDPCCPNDVVSCYPPSGSSFSPGTTTTVSCYTTNCLGAIALNQFTVTVLQAGSLDQTNIVVSSCTNLPVFFNPAVESGCCSNWQVICNPASGSTFNVGTTTTVYCVTFDSCHDTNFLNFTVTVLPGTNCTDCLQLQCPTNISTSTCSNCAVVNFAATATNACCTNRFISLTYSPLVPGSCFPIGTTVEQAKATDGCGNSTTCNFNVTVTLNPCPPIISVGPTNFILCSGPSGCVPMPDEVHASPNFFTLNNSGVSGSLSASATMALPQGTLSDPHWTLVSVPVVPPGSPLEFGTNTQLQINSLPQWLSPDPLSAWIGPANDANSDAPEGDFDYQTTFILPTDGAFTISGQVAADDNVSDILVNGISTGTSTTNGNSAAQWNSFTISGTGAAGTNRLDFIVHNNPTIGTNPPADNTDSPSGLVVEFNSITIQQVLLSPYNPAAVQATNCDGSSAPGWQSIPPGTILCSNTPITFVFTNHCGETTSYSAIITVENCCVTPPPNMVLWLTFDETVGYTCLNSAGYNNGFRCEGLAYAKNNNGPSHDVGQYVNNSLCFDGTDDMVVVSNYTAMDFGTNFSIDAWVNWSGTGTPSQVLVDHRTQSGAQMTGYEWFLNNGKPSLLLATGASSIGFSANNPIPVNVWTHLAVTVVRNSTAGVKFYTNGVLSSTFNDKPIIATSSTSCNAPLIVGNLEPALHASAPFSGCMDELELFNRALAAYEINDIYGAAHAGKCRPTCSVPAVSTICQNVNTVTVPVEVCNNGSTTQTLVVSFLGLSSAQAGGPPAVNGPAPSPIGVFGYQPVIVLPPNTCTNFTVTIVKPAGLNLANVAYYQMFIRDLNTAQQFSSIGRLQEISSIWCGVIHFQNSTNVVISSGPANIGFMLVNPGSVAYPLNSQVMVVDGNLNPETNVVSLNGLPPGTPVTNQFVIPASGSMPLMVTVNYLDAQPMTPFYLVLYLNIRYDGLSIPVASAGFMQDVSPTFGPPVNISSTNGQAVVTWDAVNTGWTLLSTTNIASTNWIPVNLPVLPQPDGSQGVTVPTTNSSQFFQLIGPPSP